MNTGFLSVWDCKAGKPETEKPEGFKVQKGDWFALGNWGLDGIKYKPYGANIDKAVETEQLHYRYVYIWDGNEWILYDPDAEGSVDVKLNYYELDILLDALVSLGGHRDLYDKLFMAHDEAWKVRK